MIIDDDDDYYYYYDYDYDYYDAYDDYDDYDDDDDDELMNWWFLYVVAMLNYDDGRAWNGFFSIVLLLVYYGLIPWDVDSKHDQFKLGKESAIKSPKLKKQTYCTTRFLTFRCTVVWAASLIMQYIQYLQ